MKKIPLISQIIIIYSTIFTLMAGLGYFLLIPAIETPYVQETYDEINYQLNEYISTGTISDRRYVYVTLPSGGEALFEGSNSMILRSQTVLLFAEEAATSSLPSGNGYLEIPTQDKEILYSYEQQPGALYLVAIIGEAHPISENAVLMAQIIGIVLLVFFLPIIVILVWSILVAQSIKSLDQRLKNGRMTQHSLILSKEIEKLDGAIGEYQKEISKNEKDKQALFQNISHELKTPITTIQSYAEGIEDGMFMGKDLKKATHVIQDETKKLLGSLNQIMELNRLSYQKQQEVPDNKKTTDLKTLIPRLIEDYKQKYPSVTFKVNLADTVYFGEEKTWLTVLTNIFENNIRHVAKNIVISGEKTTLSISNDGEKIPEDLLGRLFTPFVKGEKGSYGLGLTIIKSALELNGYSIEIKNLDQGVVYRIQRRKK